MKYWHIFDDLFITNICNPIRLFWEQSLNLKPIWLFDTTVVMSSVIIFVFFQLYKPETHTFFVWFSVIGWPAAFWLGAFRNREDYIASMDMSPNPLRNQSTFRLKYTLTIFGFSIIFFGLPNMNISTVLAGFFSICCAFILPTFFASTDAPPPPQEDIVPDLA